MNQFIAWRGAPQKIRVSNGSEFIYQVLDKWAHDRKIGIKIIEPGNPHQNGCIEGFNRSFREEVLDAYPFNPITEAQAMAHAWL